MSALLTPPQAEALRLLAAGLLVKEIGGRNG